jgi:co-chaperonin GroES (HSP10)
MPKNYIEPSTDRVIVAEGLQETIIDGITLPANAKEQEMLSGSVIFVGPAVSPLTKPHDIVLFGPYAGKHIIIDGVEFRLLREDQIEAYIRKSQ